MIYYFQSLSLKIRFLGLLLWLFPLLGLWWLLNGAPWALASLHQLSGGLGLPDQKFWVSPQDLQALFVAWDAPGRSLYLFILGPTKLGCLLVTGVFLTAATLYLLKKSNPRGPWWYLLPLVPLAMASFDFLQVVLVALALAFPGDAWDLLLWGPSAFIAAKWVALWLSLGVLGVGTGVNLIRLGWSKLKVVLDGSHGR